MVARLNPTLGAVVAVALVVGCGPASSALAVPATKLAACDDVPGITSFANDRWRTFWLSNPGRQKVVPLYACRRTTQPVRSLVRLGLSYDEIYGGGAITEIAGDVATFTSAGRYGSGTTYVDLRSLRLLQGSSSGAESGVTQLRQLLPSGALVSVTSRFGVDPAPEGVMGSGPWRVRFGDVVANDASGSRIVAEGSTFSEDGSALVSAAEGPYSLAVAAEQGAGHDAAVYFRDAQDLPHRVALAGAARALPWFESGQVTRVRRHFRVRAVPSRWATPISGTGLQFRLTRGGGIAVQALDRVRPKPWRFRTIATLARGSVKDLVARGGGVLIARFSDRPTERRLRAFGVDGHTGPLDLPVPPRADWRTLATNEAGDIAFLRGAELKVFVRQPPESSEAYVEQTAAAGRGGVVPVLARGAVYYRGPSGDLRTLRLR